MKPHVSEEDMLRRRIVAAIFLDGFLCAHVRGHSRPIWQVSFFLSQLKNDSLSVPEIHGAYQLSSPVSSEARGLSFGCCVYVVADNLILVEIFCCSTMDVCPIPNTQTKR